jgi:hypothetical protein
MGEWVERNQVRSQGSFGHFCGKSQIFRGVSPGRGCAQGSFFSFKMTTIQQLQRPGVFLSQTTVKTRVLKAASTVLLSIQMISPCHFLQPGYNSLA